MGRKKKRIKMAIKQANLRRRTNPSLELENSVVQEILKETLEPTLEPKPTKIEQVEEPPKPTVKKTTVKKAPAKTTTARKTTPRKTTTRRKKTSSSK